MYYTHRGRRPRSQSRSRSPSLQEEPPLIFPRRYRSRSPVRIVRSRDSSRRSLRSSSREARSPSPPSVVLPDNDSGFTPAVISPPHSVPYVPPPVIIQPAFSPEPRHTRHQYAPPSSSSGARQRYGAYEFGQPIFYPGPDYHPPLPGFEAVKADAPVWNKYYQEAMKQDNDITDKWNHNMDVILAFAALFSAVLTAFLIEFYKGLKPDPQQAAADFLKNITLTLQVLVNNQASTSLNSSSDLDPFSPTKAVIWVNALWFSSLTLSLGAALAAMVIKQWLQFYKITTLSGTVYDLAQRRQYRYNALHHWHVPSIVFALPLLLHLSVGLFLFGLVVQLWQINMPIAILILALLSGFVMCYMVTLLLPLVYPACPYKSSALLQVQETVHDIHVNIWDLICRISVGWNMIMQKQKLPYLFPVDKFHQNYNQTHSHPPSSLEIENIAELQPQLDMDSIIWLMKVSQQKDDIHWALEFLQQIHYAPGMEKKLLEHNIPELLVQKAKILLPSPQDDFWRELSTIPGHLIMPRLQESIAYMISLMSIWHFPPYLSESCPPAVTSMEKYKAYEPLFGNWILLWRSVKRECEDNLDWVRTRGWDLDSFSILICTEVHYYCLHPGTPPICGFSLERSDINDPNILSDLHEILQTILSKQSLLKDNTACLVMDTLSYVLANMESVRLDLLLTLLKLLKSYHMSYGAILQRVIRCIQLFALDNSSSRKQFIIKDDIAYMEAMSDNDLNLLTTDVLSKIIKIHCSPEVGEVTPVMALVVQQLSEAVLQVDNPTIDFSIFTNLPIEYADNFLHNFSITAAPWRAMHSVQWLIDLICNWYMSDRLSYIGREDCLTVLGNLLAIEWSDKELALIAGKILPFLASLLASSNDNMVNVVCTKLCYMLGRSLQSKKGGIGFLTLFIENGTIDAICAFLQSGAKDVDCQWNWIKLLNVWEKSMNNSGPTFIEGEAYRQLVQVVCVVIPAETTSMGYMAPKPIFSDHLESSPEQVPGTLEEEQSFAEIDHFAIGSHYGPVLEPFIVNVLKANIVVNPLLQPSSNGLSNNQLHWNMLFTVEGDDDPDGFWQKKCDEPATFPRVKSLHIISHNFPWKINVQAHRRSIGVTCKDVIDQIKHYMSKLLPKMEYDSASSTHKQEMLKAYHDNRSITSTFVSNRMLGLRRIDWLAQQTIFGGLFVNDDIVMDICGDCPSCYFELKCLSSDVQSSEFESS